MAKKKRRKKGIKHRTKGHDYERLIAQDYRDLGYTAVRAIQSRGAEKCDINVEGLPFWFECHCSDRPRVFDKLRQALRDRKEGQPIILHIKQNMKPKTKGDPHPLHEVVVLEKEYWYELLKALRSLVGEDQPKEFFARGLVESLLKERA